VSSGDRHRRDEASTGSPDLSLGVAPLQRRRASPGETSRSPCPASPRRNFGCPTAQRRQLLSHRMAARMGALYLW